MLYQTGTYSLHFATLKQFTSQPTSRSSLHSGKLLEKFGDNLFRIFDVLKFIAEKCLDRVYRKWCQFSGQIVEIHVHQNKVGLAVMYKNKLDAKPTTSFSQTNFGLLTWSFGEKFRTENQVRYFSGSSFSDEACKYIIWLGLLIEWFSEGILKNGS